MSPPEVSVIIPTYNRPDSVLRALDSLSQQTLAPDCYEVIVVDDGSAYDSTAVTSHSFPFAWQYRRQENQGATIARNNGVGLSRGRVLVFMDDDVTISPGTLAALAQACRRREKVVAMGRLISRSTNDGNPFTQDAIAQANRMHAGDGRDRDRFVHFSWCNTQLLAVNRDDFFALGMLQDPTGGWPNWDDVDFGYRAHLAGFRLLQVGGAVGEHWDYSLADLKAACRRWQRAGKSAVRLFQLHPGLQPHIPMFHDKTPIRWRQDSPRLVARKAARHVAAWPPVLWGLERTASLLEKALPRPGLLRPFYRWIQGSYMFRGFREGLREYA